MFIKEELQRYVDAVKVHQDKHTSLAQAFYQYNENNVFFEDDTLLNAYSQTLENLTCPEVMEWVNWWIYDTNFGTRGHSFWIGEVEYKADEVSFSDFCNLVLRDASNN